MLKRAFKFGDVLVGGRIDVPPRLMSAEGAVKNLRSNCWPMAKRRTHASVIFWLSFLAMLLVELDA